MRAPAPGVAGLGRSLRRALWALACLWALGGPFRAFAAESGAEAAAEAGPGSVLVLGRVSDDPGAHYAQLKPLLDYVVPRMRAVGIREGRILMARDARQMASYLRRGRVDWVTEAAGTSTVLAQRGGAQALLLTERSGARQYSTVFFVRRDSPIQRLEQLRGHTLALQSPTSTSGYLLPMDALLEQGLSPEILLSPKDAAAAGSVGYVFARSKLNISTYVYRRLADAGAFSDLDWNDERRVPAAFRRELRIIHVTAPVPRALEMVRGDLPPAVAQRLREVLLEAAQDPRAAPALQRFFGATGFHRVDATTQRRLQQLGAGVRRVRMQVE